MTKAQWFLLVEISDRPQIVSKAHRPAVKLVQLGFASKCGSTLQITEAGRDALRSYGEKS